MRRAFLVLLAGCTTVKQPDVCAQFAAQACIALEVAGPSVAEVDQLRVTGLRGFRTIGGNSARTPETPDLTRLPVVLAVVPPDSFPGGDFILDVRGFRAGAIAGEGKVSGTVARGQHVHVTVQMSTGRLLFSSPSLRKLNPDALCVGVGGTIAATGTFTAINGVPPSAKLDDQLLSTITGTCTPFTGTALGDGLNCTDLAFVVDQPTLGTHQVSIVNPPPLEDTASSATALEVLAAPSITQVSFQTSCSNTQGLTLQGTRFYRVGTDGPSVEVDGLPVGVRIVGSCSTVHNGLSTQVESCTLLQIGPQSAGHHSVQVFGADPLGCGSNVAQFDCL